MIPTWVTLILVAVFVVAIPVGLWARLRRPGVVTHHWVSLPPGVLPLGDPPPAVEGRRQGVVPVRFQAPDGLAAHEVAGLLGGEAMRRAPLAMLFEAAAAGRVRLGLQPDGDLAVETADDEPARQGGPVGRLLVDVHDLEPDGPVLVSRSRGLRRAFRRAHRDVSGHNERQGWSEPRPALWADGSFVVLAVLLIPVVGATLFALLCLVFTYYGLATDAWAWGLTSLLGAAAFVACLPMKIRREILTAEGTARWEQVVGFRKYLAAAEAGQLRLDEATLTFSRHLPMAIVFGIADHWIDVFEGERRRAAGQGAVLPVPEWFSGQDLHGLGAGIDRAAAVSRDAAPRSTWRQDSAAGSEDAQG